jgi:hypothetical protein
MESDRVERLLTALLLETMREEQQSRKILVLSRAGLSNPEVAHALGTTKGVVGQTLYANRRSKGTRKSKGAKKKR